ncbi:MAG TPA: hypothetical protein VFD92_04810 [Candidatus Binatia bacterium]|nr:hypothetical protein [Candidatus Binatia bacterium]
MLYCECETPLIDVDHDAGCRRCGCPVLFGATAGERRPPGDAMTTATLPRRTLRAKYPCCGRLALFTAIADVPRETYDRTCPSCRKIWYVDRSDLGSPREGVHLDKLEWTDRGITRRTRRVA